MGIIKNHAKTLKISILKYVLLGFVTSLVGMRLITWMTELMFSRYRSSNPITGIVVESEKVTWQGGGNVAVYWILANLNYVLIPLWVILCVGTAGLLFYNRELREPIGILMKASNQISQNELDFRVDYDRDNEMGRLCSAFEDMRQKLYDSNMEIWNSMEERKRLSAAFSHDLRNPLTVLSGYVELMQKYGDRLPAEKQADILDKMDTEIERLKRYTEEMNEVQKLEDIPLDVKETTLASLRNRLSETGVLLCSDGVVSFSLLSDANEEKKITIDEALIMQVYENLIANALRYARSEIAVRVAMQESRLMITVSDDGKGFSEEALRKAALAFYREDKGSGSHFGLGLYICRLLCRKHGGDIELKNGEHGGARILATFEER